MLIFAIVVTFNPDKELLLKQYHALIKQVDRIVYVDNGSETDFVSDINGFDGVIVIKNHANMGLGKAQNQGIIEAKKQNADMILLMDQDSIPLENMVGTMLNEFCLSKEEVAAISPVIKNAFDNSVDYVGTIDLGLKIKTQILSRTTNVAYTIASGTLIPIPVFERVGLIDEKMFIDGLDLEWCMRAHYCGFKILQTPNAILCHELGLGAKNKILNHSPKREYFIIRNSLYLLRLKHIPFGYKVRKFFWCIGRIFYSLLHGYFQHFLNGIKGIKDSRFMCV